MIDFIRYGDSMPESLASLSSSGTASVAGSRPVSAASLFSKKSGNGQSLFRSVRVFVKSFDQELSEFSCKIPYRDDHYIVKLT